MFLLPNKKITPRGWRLLHTSLPTQRGCTLFHDSRVSAKTRASIVLSKRNAISLSHPVMVASSDLSQVLLALRVPQDTHSIRTQQVLILTAATSIVRMPNGNAHRPCSKLREVLDTAPSLEQISAS